MSPPDQRTGSTRLSVDARGRTLARNTLVNIVGHLAPLLVNVATVPFVIDELGTERFGLLSLAWLVVGYFAFFDFGIGIATTRFVAQYIARDERQRLPALVWTASLTQLALGILAAALLAGLTPVLVNDALNVSGTVRAEARWMFFILALTLPISFATGSFVGVLSALQRFDIINLINIPAACLTYSLPALALLLGYGIRTCVAVILGVRVVTLILTVAACWRLVPELRAALAFDRSVARAILAFGGWAAVSAAMAPVLVYTDRFVLGALVSVAAVGIFSLPFLIATKLVILPASLLMTLFPAITASHASGDSAWIRLAIVRAMRAMVLGLGPLVVVLGFFSRDVLTIWLGVDLASQGVVVLQILAVGVFFNGVTHVPVSLLHGIGRPDVTAKLQIAQAPIHFVALMLLTIQYGLVGTAIACAARMVLECALFLAAAHRLGRVSLVGLETLQSAGLLAALICAFLLTWWLVPGLVVRLPAAAILMTAFILVAWRRLLDKDERCQIASWLRLRPR